MHVIIRFLVLKSRRAYTSIRLLNIVNESCTIRLPDNTHHLSHTRSNYHSFKHSNTHTRAHTTYRWVDIGLWLYYIVCSLLINTHHTHTLESICVKHVIRFAVSVSITLVDSARLIYERATCCSWVCVCLFHCQWSLNQIDQFWHVHTCHAHSRTNTMAHKQMRVLSMIWASILSHYRLAVPLFATASKPFHDFRFRRFINKFNECDRSPIVNQN